MPEPVSYTHLDVYKRQDQELLPQIRQGLAQKGIGHLLDAAREGRIGIDLSLIHI